MFILLFKINIIICLFASFYVFLTLHKKAKKVNEKSAKCDNIFVRLIH